MMNKPNSPNSVNKPMTAGQYRKLMQKKRAKLPTELVTAPTGMVFEMRRPDLNAYIVTGRYPQSLVNEGIKALKEAGIAPTDPQAAEAITKSLDSEEFTEALIFMRELVRESCVYPKIVLGAQGDDEIDPSEIDIEDFNHLVGWCLNYTGVENAAGIRSFRQQRKSSVSNRSNGKKLRRSTVKTS